MTKSIFRSSLRGLFRSLLIGITLAFFCLSASAQSEYDAHLVGHVIDEKTGEHLPYVNIQIKGTNIGTVTDESGHYFLKNLTPGRDANYIYGPTQPRTYFLGLALKL